jgi:hypothetical protein
VPSTEAAEDLGYDLSDTRGLPSALLAMLPTGPDLSPADAIAGRATTSTAPGCTSH